MALIQKYDEFAELNAAILNELVEKIVIHESHKDEDGNKIREIEIFYRFVGKIE